MTDATELNRLFWHSRRGMLELDLLLVPFVREVFASLDACVEPLLSFSESAAHPQIKARELVVEVPHPGKPAQRQIAHPIKFSSGVAAPRHIGAALGAHNQEVLRELGYSAEQITELKAAKVIG